LKKKPTKDTFPKEKEEVEKKKKEKNVLLLFLHSQLNFFGTPRQ
jgi:hypothetical protein